MQVASQSSAHKMLCPDASIKRCRPFVLPSQKVLMNFIAEECIGEPCPLASDDRIKVAFGIYLCRMECGSCNRLIHGHKGVIDSFIYTCTVYCICLPQRRLTSHRLACVGVYVSHNQGMCLSSQLCASLIAR